MKVPWAVTEDKVEAAIRKIVEICRPRKLVLFGSFLTENIDINSDIDILVVVRDEIPDTRRESVRIRKALRGISMSMDILVVRESRLEKLADAPGMIYREILTNGHVVYESGE